MPPLAIERGLPATPGFLDENKGDIMRIFGILLCLIALGLTGYSAIAYKAPGIEEDIEARTAQAISAIAGDDVEVRVDGRHVTLSGAVGGAEQKQAMLSAVAAVPGALGPVDALERMATASDYRIDVVKDESGRVTIEGMAPDPASKEAIAAEAGALFGDDLDVDVEIVRGTPSEDWQTAAVSSLDALATMRHGRLSITGSDIVLEGEVAGDADVEAIDMFAETIPEKFTWTHDVGVHREKAEPFTFSVVKDPDGGLRLSGFAPDEETRETLIERGQAIGGDKPVIADVRVADGMPDEEWPSLVLAGIEAMKDMDAGRFDVVGNDVSFASGPEITVTEITPEADQTSTPAAATAEEDAVLFRGRPPGCRSGAAG